MSIIHVSKDTFESDVLGAAKPVIVDFWATWCTPCQMMAPVLEELAAEHSELIVAKVDVDQNPELAIEYGINSIPAILLFNGGQVDAQVIGFRPKEELLDELEL